MQLVFVILIHWIAIHPVDSAIQLLNYRDLLVNIHWHSWKLKNLKLGNFPSKGEKSSLALDVSLLSLTVEWSISRTALLGSTGQHDLWIKSERPTHYASALWTLCDPSLIFYVYWLPFFWKYESKIYLLCPFLSFWGSWDSTKISTIPERITGREAYTTPDPDWVWHLWWFWENLCQETTRNFFKNVCWS